MVTKLHARHSKHVSLLLGYGLFNQQKHGVLWELDPPRP